MSKGQKLIDELMRKLIRDREECVEVPTLLTELAKKYNDYTDEEKVDISRALFGEENVAE